MLYIPLLVIVLDAHGVVSEPLILANHKSGPDSRHTLSIVSFIIVSRALQKSLGLLQKDKLVAKASYLIT